MCLLIQAPKGTDKYSTFLIDGIIKASLSNTDGIGFAYKKAKDKDNVFIDKGFASVDSFLKVYRAHKLAKADEVMIHLRIGNKGAKNADMNHPFVISTEEETILSRDTKVQLPVLAHNGTFHSFSKTNDNKSDTYYFTQEMMSYSYIQQFLLEDIEGFKLLFKTTLGTNKVGFIFPGETEMFKLGDFIEDEGYLFSNISYKEDRYKNVGGYDEYDYYHGHNNNNNWRRNNPIITPLLPLVTAAAKDFESIVPKTLGEGITRHSYGDRWIHKFNKFLYVPYSFMSKRQFDESVFLPMSFNHTHYKFHACRTLPAKGLIANTWYKIEIPDDRFEDDLQCYTLYPMYGDRDDWSTKAYVSYKDLMQNFSLHLEPAWVDVYNDLFKLIQANQNQEITLEFCQELKDVIGIDSKTVGANTRGFRISTCIWTNSFKLWYNYLMLNYFPDEQVELYKVQDEDKEKEVNVYTD